MRTKTIQNAFFITILLAVTFAFLVLILDFVQPIFWAAVLAVLFRPVHQRVLDRFGGRETLASVLTLLLILVIVILPLFLIGLAVANEATGLYQRISSGEIDLQEPLDAFRSQLPLVTDLLDRVGVDIEKIRQGLSDAAVTVSSYLASQALVIGQNALRFTVMFFLMLYLLFFFLRDGDRLLNALVRALPLGDTRERLLFSRFAEVSRATIKGTFVVAIVQGTLGGLIFWILGINAAVFWGVIMAVLSLLPAVGSAIIWLPAAIILMVTGSVVKGIILIVVGALIIGMVDNVLRPVLVGRDTKMADYLILLTTLGGLAVFGISGFVIGPIIAALFLSVWEMFIEEYGSVDDIPPVDEPDTDLLLPAENPPDPLLPTSESE
ncbi:MAG TPA: AI-2E family transporter [Rhodothermales bacterium]|nr:AI-2E family transporter [Rhodothermales bacterium]